MSNEIVTVPANGMLTAFRDLDQMLLVADRLSGSTIVPEAYRKQPGNILIALNTAQRLQMDPMMVMQNLYVVHGHPSWSGKFVIALLRRSRNYSRVEYVNLNGSDWRGGLKMVGHRWDGGTDEGPEITPELVERSGWKQKNGSKWQEMPEQMYRYRAASWFASSCCPEVLLGLPTVEDMEDEGPREVREAKARVVDSSADSAAAAPADQPRDTAGLGVRRGGAVAKPVMREGAAIALPALDACAKVKAAVKAAGVKWELFTKWLEGRKVTLPQDADRDAWVRFCEFLVSEPELCAAAQEDLKVNLVD